MMMLSRRAGLGLSLILMLIPVWVAGCGDEYQGSGSGKGGATSAQGGASAATGGQVQTPATGGATAGTTGGLTVTGGTVSNTTASVGTGGVTATSSSVVGLGGKTSSAGGTSSTTVISTVVCDTTRSTKPSEITTFGCGKAGFELNTAASNNTNATFTVTKVSPLGGPRNLCTDGCAVLTLPFIAGDLASTKGAVVDKGFAATTSLVGAKIVARIAINKPAPNTPIQFKLFAQTGSPDWIMAERAITDTSEYALSTGAKDYEYVIVDRLVVGKQFCSAQTLRYGLQVQTAGTISDETAGSVSIYVQSISLITPVGTAGASGVGGCGVTNGSAGNAGATSNAGAAGSTGKGGHGGVAGRTGT